MLSKCTTRTRTEIETVDFVVDFLTLIGLDK